MGTYIGGADEAIGSTLVLMLSFGNGRKINRECSDKEKGEEEDG